MFDVHSDEIALLDDETLRELIAKLCEAELAACGASVAGVTWGGNQNAADGGLDVRVEHSPPTAVAGFIPKAKNGFQVKKPDMPRAAIIAEMMPGGVVRPVINELANENGAYIIVSSTGSTSDAALRARRQAMRDSLVGVKSAHQLHTDFYDRTRVATWVNRHPGVIAWVKEKVGRKTAGWKPYGPWSNSSEDKGAEYIADDKGRLIFGDEQSDEPTGIILGINRLREMLAKPGRVVRLVGLSGVGKTRLLQSLFDDRIGVNALPKAAAVYADLADSPDPHPLAMVSDLIARKLSAVVIVDNCPPDLHRRLADSAKSPDSTVSVATVEYDIRDDEPEGTKVVKLETSSTKLISKLVSIRFPDISGTDADTIADISGGNARIAIALANTVEKSETLAGLSDDELFQRLFRQRHDNSDALLLAAQACALLYSFQGESLSGDEAELPILANLIGQSPAELFRHVAELKRRDLVQVRSVWRAVLPHAVANRLAGMALQNIPIELIENGIVQKGKDRLAQSFSRRLSYLHNNAAAVSIAEKWLSPNGLLGDPTKFNKLGVAMFTNVAPVAPLAVLQSLERVAKNNSPDVSGDTLFNHIKLPVVGFSGSQAQASAPAC